MLRDVLPRPLRPEPLRLFALDWLVRPPRLADELRELRARGWELDF